jgi:hypothetical protein
VATLLLTLLLQHDALREWLLTRTPQRSDFAVEPLKSIDKAATAALRVWVEQGYPLLAERRAEAKRLVADLGAEELAARDDAEARLTRIAGLATAELKAALAEASDAETKARLERILSTADPLQAARFRVRAARALVGVRDRDVVPLLVAMRRDPEPFVRDEAQRLLRRVSRNIDAADADAWAAWWKKQGDEFKVPEDALRSGSHLRPGHTLIGSASGVVELDPAGKVVWKHAIAGVRRAQRLENGNTLVVAGLKVVEVTPRGETPWSMDFKASSLFYAHRLDDGTTWVGYVVGREGHLVLVDEKKQEKERVQGVEWPLTFQPLEDGGLVINQHSTHRVVHVDAQRKGVWEWQGAQFYGVRRLENGNTLVGTDTRVIELDAAGKEVWSVDSPCGKYLYGLKRLSNGNTILGAYGGSVAEVDAAGKVVWRYEGDGGMQAMDVDRGE